MAKSCFEGFPRAGKGGGGKTNFGNAAPGDVAAGKLFSSAMFINTPGTLALTGNATAAQVLNTKTYYDNDLYTKRTGTMPDNSGINYPTATQYLAGTPGIIDIYVPGGYHDGSHIVGLTDANFIQNNLRANKSVFGLAGKLTSIGGSPQRVKVVNQSVPAYNVASADLISLTGPGILKEVWCAGGDISYYSMYASISIDGGTYVDIGCVAASANNAGFSYAGSSIYCEVVFTSSLKIRLKQPYQSTSVSNYVAAVWLPI